jgi:glycosyltransferase involved in cell wall biosynthesis
MNTIDVVVPCYGYGHFLRTCVESVLEQTEMDVRVLIIDDASPDNTSEVAAGLASEDCRVSWLRHSLNQGHIATYNEGISRATADYLLILSPDDYVLPGSLHRATALMESNKRIAFTFGAAFILHCDTGTKYLDQRVRCSGSTRVMTGYEFIKESGHICLVNTPTAIVRTRLQQAVGGYNPELPHSGDVEMWLRLAAHGDIGYVSVPQAVYRRHAANMSLAYYADGGLQDFRQRAAALNCFFAEYSEAIPRGRQLQRRISYSLSSNAIDLASMYWERGREHSEALLHFAQHTCVYSRFSMSFLKFSLKRCLGSRRYSALRSLRQRFAPRRAELNEVVE